MPESNMTRRMILARLRIWKNQVGRYGVQAGTAEKYVWGEWDEKVMAYLESLLQGANSVDQAAPPHEDIKRDWAYSVLGNLPFRDDDKDFTYLMNRLDELLKPPTEIEGDYVCPWCRDYKARELRGETNPDEELTRVALAKRLRTPSVSRKEAADARK